MQNSIADQPGSPKVLPEVDNDEKMEGFIKQFLEASGMHNASEAKSDELDGKEKLPAQGSSN